LLGGSNTITWILIFAFGFCAAKVSSYLYLWLRSTWTVHSERVRGEILSGVTATPEMYDDFGYAILHSTDNEMLMFKSGAIYWMLYIQRWLAKVERREFDSLRSAWVDLDRSGYNTILEMNRLVIADNFPVLGENKKRDEKDATALVGVLKGAMEELYFVGPRVD